MSAAAAAPMSTMAAHTMVPSTLEGVEPSPKLDKMREISVSSMASSSLSSWSTRTVTKRATRAKTQSARNAATAAPTVGASPTTVVNACSAGPVTKRSTVVFPPALVSIDGARSIIVVLVIRSGVVAGARALHDPIDGRCAQHACELDQGGQRSHARHHSVRQAGGRLLVQSDEEQGAYVDSRRHSGKQRQLYAGQPGTVSVWRRRHQAPAL